MEKNGDKAMLKHIYDEEKSWKYEKIERIQYFQRFVINCVIMEL